MDRSLTTITRIAPEDLTEGSFVTVLRAVCELPSFLWCGDRLPGTAGQPVLYAHTPADSGTPMRVESVCLPFVFVRLPDGTHQTLDARRAELGRLSDAYAERVWKKMVKASVSASRLSRRLL